MRMDAGIPRFRFSEYCGCLKFSGFSELCTKRLGDAVDAGAFKEIAHDAYVPK